MQELRCKKCHEVLDPDNVVERLAVARCSSCNAIFSLDPAEGSSVGEEPAIRPNVSMPAGLEMVEHRSVLQLKRRWYSPLLWFLVVFCLFWNGFMVVWHAIAISSGAWFMSLFGLLHTGVGLYLLYFTIAGFVNTTFVHAGMGLLEIKHKPLPWPGQKSISTNAIDQVYCKERVKHRRNGSSTTYEVLALREDDRSTITLLKGLHEPQQALYIEQELERFLKIDDRRVLGEY